MRKLLLLALLPALALAQVRPPSSAVGPDGVSTQALTAPRFDPPAQDFIFYVDPAGSDSNDCLTVGTPCLTIPVAIAKIPQYWKQKARVILAAGNYSVTNLRIQVGYPLRGGEQFVLQGAMVDSGLGTRAITSVGTVGSAVYQVTDSALSGTITEDQYLGYWVRITDGPAIGMQRMVRYNSTTGMFEMNVPDIGVHPVVGNHFVIERPGSIITFDGYLSFTGMSFPNSNGSQLSIVLHQLRFVRSGTGYARIGTGGLFAKTVSMELGAGSLQVGNETTLTAGEYVTDVVSSDILANTNLYGSGLFLSGTSASILRAMGTGRIYGYYVSSGCKIQAYNCDSQLDLNALLLKTAGIEVWCGEIRTGTVFGLAGKIKSAPGVGITVANGGSGTIGGLDISNSVSDGIRLDGNSYLYSYSSIMTGTGNGGAGVSVQNGSTYGAYITGNTITGTGGEIKVGTQTTTHAAVFGGTPLADLIGGLATNGTPTASNLSGTNTGDVTLTAVGSTPNANGASASGQALTLQPADGTHPGVISELAQTLGGQKTFATPITLTPTALGTCGTAPNVEGTMVTVPGVTTTPTKLCVCTYTPTGSVYAWVNALANSAGTGIGDTTSCP